MRRFTFVLCQLNETWQGLAQASECFVIDILVKIVNHFRVFLSKFKALYLSFWQLVILVVLPFILSALMNSF